MTQTVTESSNVLSNGAKLVGEALLPGASLLMDGKFLNGAAHTVIGLGAKALLGPAALMVVCADSFAKSVTDKSLYGHASDAWASRTFLKGKSKDVTTVEATPVEA
jgi:hypothetical protein